MIMNKRQRKKQAKVTSMALNTLRDTIEKFIDNMKSDPKGMRKKIIDSDLPVAVKGEAILMTYYYEGVAADD
jgi:hypothetical protein